MRGSRNIIISAIVSLGAAGSIMADAAIATQTANASVRWLLRRNSQHLVSRMN